MSMVSTWALAQDGKFYKNPVLRGTRPDGAEWFLCFDDDDPPELVMEAGPDFDWKQTAASILGAIGPRYRIMRRGPMRSGRSFQGEFKPAEAIFVELLDPIPVPTESDGSGDWNDVLKRECVFYPFGRKRPTPASTPDTAKEYPPRPDVS